MPQSSFCQKICILRPEPPAHCPLFVRSLSALVRSLSAPYVSGCKVSILPSVYVGLHCPLFVRSLSALVRSLSALVRSPAVRNLHSFVICFFEFVFCSGLSIAESYVSQEVSPVQQGLICVCCNITSSTGIEWCERSFFV